MSISVQEGTRVQIKKYSEYGSKFTGYKGTVVRSSGGRIGVDLDKAVNDKSKYGCFWFSSDSLKVLQDNGGNDMALTGDYKIATVKILGGHYDKEYNYALYPSEQETIHVGDYALVEGPFDGDPYKVVKVTEISDKENASFTNVTKEVICLVDGSNYHHRQEVRKQKASMKKELDKLVKQNQELVLYEALAEKIPAIKDMLETYKNLDNV